MLKSLKETCERQEIAGQPSILVVPDNLREFLSRFVRHSAPGLNVLAFSEIPENKQVKIIASAGGEAGTQQQGAL